MSIRKSELKTAREAAGLTQFQLAVAAGLSVAAIQKIEAGARTPMPETLRRLRAAVDAPIGQIVGES